MNIKNIKIGELTPYEKNTKKHDAKQIANVAESIRQYGFVQPLVVDAHNVVVIGHCRLLAAKKLNMTEVPCVCVDDLTDEQVRALRIVDNKSNESPWDFDLLGDELADIDLSEFDFDFGIDVPGEESNFDEDAEQERIFKERMENGELSDDDEEYQAFLEKFEAKKTTDDCYTPDNIYEAVKRWCVERYNLKGKKTLRPFYPGGDYQKEDYSGNCVVIDNPPFSIISEICEYYVERNIPFFMFAPTLTLLGIARGTMKYVACGATVTYENGANVNTSFVTNLGEVKIVASAELRNILEEVNKANLKKMHKELPKYAYPDEVLTGTMLCYLAAHNISIEISEKDVYFIRALDSQKQSGKGLFGSGFLLSEKAAAEKAAAEKWELSKRERDIIKSLGDTHD